MEIKNIQCKNCRFALTLTTDRSGKKEILGYECRRHAPVQSGWPIVGPFGWCGDSAHKDPEE